MTDLTDRAWAEYRHGTTLEMELQINQLQRENARLRGELDCAMAGLASMHKVLFSQAQLRLKLEAEIETLRLTRRESGTAEREALYRLVNGRNDHA